MRDHSTFVAVWFATIGFITTFLVGMEPSLSQTLHVISVADTKDPQMGVEFNLNNNEIHKYVTSLSKTTNLVLDLVDVSGDSYSCDSIEVAIKNLSVKSEDVVIFFHSGHGNSPRHDVNDETSFIYPSIECAPALGDRTLNLSDLFKLLMGKKARLTIVGADSCNNIVSAPQAKLAPALIAPTAVIRTMFLKYEGSILIASSSPGEFSFYPNNSIGLFTKQFIDALNNPSVVKPDLIWEQVIARAARPIDVPPHQSPPQDKQHPPHSEELRYLPPQ
jgi:Caspase domain